MHVIQLYQCKARKGLEAQAVITLSAISYAKENKSENMQLGSCVIIDTSMITQTCMKQSQNND